VRKGRTKEKCTERRWGQEEGKNAKDKEEGKGTYYHEDALLDRLAARVGWIF
jgi:hypothetical protein